MPYYDRGESLSKTAEHAARERGFALVVVIWVLALLALLAGAVAADTHNESVVARNRLAIEQLRAVAEAGINIAAFHLGSPDAGLRWQADGREYDAEYSGVKITISAQDEGGKIDLNEAPIELIAGLLDEFGVEPNQRSLLVNAITSRREAFAQSRLTAPRRFFQRDPRRNMNLGNLAFADILELRLLPGMTLPLYSELAPEVTVYSQSRTINPLTAPRAGLLAIPGLDPGDADALLVERATATGLTDLSQISDARYFQIADQSTVTIRAKAGTGGASFTQEAVVLVSPELPLQAARVLRWREAIQ